MNINFTGNILRVETILTGQIIFGHTDVLINDSRPSSPVRQDGERRTTFLDVYAFRRVPFFSFWLIFLCAYL